VLADPVRRVLLARHSSVALVGLVGSLACQRRAPCATPSSPHTCLVARVTGDVPGGELGFRFGEPLDLDGDGIGDLAAGARFAGDLGYVQVWSHGAPAARWPGEWPGGLYGQDVIAVPDLDGDGRADLVISAPSARLGDRVVGIVEARTAGGTRLWRTIGEPGEGLGWQLAVAGDQDGDGVQDLWAGAPANPSAGHVYLLSGRDGHVLGRIDSTRREDGFGWYVAAIGDLDGDGKPDVVIGAPYADLGTGAVSFAASTGARLRELPGELPESHFGEIVVGLDDVDGDGVPEVAIGAPGSPSKAATRGDVVIVSGKTGAILHRLAQAQPGELYGRQLALLDDLDGDGVRELAIGAPWAAPEGRARAGRVEVRSLRGMGLVAELRGTVADGWLGWHVARAGAALPGPGMVVGALRSDRAAGALELHAFR
jgi:FG-GAP repeat